MPLPANYRPFHPFNNGELLVRDEQLAPWPRTPEVVRSHLTDYYGVITYLDMQIGRILQALKDQGRTTTRSSSSPRTTAWRSAATASSASRTSTRTA